MQRWQISCAAPRNVSVRHGQSLVASETHLPAASPLTVGEHVRAAAAARDRS